MPKPVDFIISDADLHTVLAEIDTELRASGTKLFGREIHGLSLFCRKFKLEMAWSDPLAVRVFDWFTKQYGDRPKGNLDFGNTVGEIRHDLYSLRFPRLYGTEIVHCDPMLLGVNLGPHRRIGQGPLRPLKSNLFDNLAGVTNEFVKSLTVQNCENLLDVYARGFIGLTRMDDAKDAPYCKIALDDLHQSASHLISHNPSYGLSRWASLQSAEKLLKSFIKLHGGKFLKTHNLTELASSAVLLGLPAPRPTLLQEIQCDADVRYEATNVGKEEALRAHYAVLSLCGAIAPRLRPQSGWVTEVRRLSYALNGVPRPMKALRVSRLKRA
jgi:HEPN domain-containing protein